MIAWTWAYVDNRFDTEALFIVTHTSGADVTSCGLQISLFHTGKNHPETHHHRRKNVVLVCFFFIESEGEIQNENAWHHQIINEFGSAIFDDDVVSFMQYDTFISDKLCSLPL